MKKDILKTVTGNDSVFYKIVKDQLDQTQNGEHVEEELSNMSLSKDKNDWLKNHPLVGLATNFDNKTSISYGMSSKNVGLYLRSIVKNRNGFTEALINKLIMNQDFVRLFVINKIFKDAIIKSLITYNDSIVPVTTESQKNQE